MPVFKGPPFNLSVLRGLAKLESVIFKNSRGFMYPWYYYNTYTVWILFLQFFIN